MAEVDSLDIQISAQVNKANASLTTLVNRLDKVSASLANVNSRGLATLGAGVNKLSNAMANFSNNTKTADFTRLAKGIEKFNDIDSSKLNLTAGALNNLSKSLSSIGNVTFNSGGLNNLASAVSKFGSKISTQATANLTQIQRDLTNFVQGMNKIGAVNFDMTGLANLITSINKLGGKSATQATANLPTISAQLQNFVRQLNNIGSLNFNTTNLGNLITSINKLGGKSITNAITNLPTLTSGLNNLMTTLSRAPSVSNNVIQMTNALANLASQGSRVGTASNTLVNGLNRSTSAMNRATKSSKSLASAIGKFYAKWFLVVCGVKKLWSSVESSMNYIEVLNYFDAAFTQVAEKADYSSFREMGEEAEEKAAEEYANSFAKRAKELTSKMTGFEISPTGTLEATGIPSLGLDPSQLMTYQAMFGQMASSMGVASETAVKLSDALSMIGADLAELELAINGLKEQIAELDKQEAALDEAVKAYDEASSGIIELKCELSDLERKANESLVKQKKDLQLQIDEKTEKIGNLIKKISANSKFIFNYRQEIEKSEEERKRLLQIWNETKQEEFDENTTICPTCHRELPQEEQERLLREFEKVKSERLKKIEQDGEEEKKNIENSKTMIKQLEEMNDDYNKEKEGIKQELETLEKQLSELPQSINISDTEEYKAIQKQIDEKEAALNVMNNHSEKRAEIKAERQKLLDEISEKKAVILKYQADTEQKDKNVSALEEDLRNKNQNVADTEQKIDLLKDFSIEKNRALAKEINPHFKHFQFDFVEYTQEGNPVETLKLVCGGTSYFDGLNHGDKILTECDLVCGLQELNGLNMPVWLDDVESLDSDRIPKIKQQLILLEKTNDEELKIEEVR